MKAYFALVTEVYPLYPVATVSRRFFDINMTKTGLSYFLIGDAKKRTLRLMGILVICRVFSDPVTYDI